jgi:hypothetical protein
MAGHMAGHISEKVAPAQRISYTATGVMAGVALGFAAAAPLALRPAATRAWEERPRREGRGLVSGSVRCC